MRTQWAVLYCAKGGKRRAEKRWKELEQCLLKAHIDTVCFYCENANSVERLIQKIINQGYYRIIVVGGDSAMNDAVNVAMQQEEATRQQLILGMIPNGVANDFARYWKLYPNNWKKAVETIQNGTTRKLDVGVVWYKDMQDNKKQRFFINSVNMGLVARVMQLRKQMHRLLGTRTLSYLFTFGLMLFQRMRFGYRLKVDGRVKEGTMMSLCVGNTSGYGQVPHAVPYDGVLDMTLLAVPRVWQLLEGFYLYCFGTLLNHSHVQAHRLREIVVEDCDNAPISIDGRPFDKLKGKFTIKVEYEALKVIIPY